MNFEQFKQDALRTESRPTELGLSKVAIHNALNAISNFTELADIVKKSVFYGKPINHTVVSQFVLNTSAFMHFMQATMHHEQHAKVYEDSLSDPNMRILHGALGMFTEAGEMLQAVLRQMETGELDLVNMVEETGDSDWYKAIIHDETGVSENTVREKVIAKLKARYGDKFTAEAAINRDLVAERKVLEA